MWTHALIVFTRQLSPIKSWEFIKGYNQLSSPGNRSGGAFKKFPANSNITKFIVLKLSTSYQLAAKFVENHEKDTKDYEDLPRFLELKNVSSCLTLRNIQYDSTGF